MLIKLLGFGFTIADALGCFFILSTLLGLQVVSYLFPKRPDLFKEMHSLQKELQELKATSERQESDITGLKFGATRR